MKQIKNWTLGAFFRTLGRYLFYLLIGALLILVHQKYPLILRVDALTSAPYSTRTIGVSWVDEAISNQQYNSANFNTTLRPPEGYAPPLNHMRNIVFTVNTSSTWKAGNIYTFTATFWTSSPDVAEWKRLYTFDPWTSVNQNGSNGIQGSDNANVQQFNCLINVDAEETNYVMSCTFIPKRDIKQFTIFWRGLSEFATYQYTTSILWWGMEFTYTEDVAGAINNQTTIIQNNFQETNNNIKELEDTITDDSSPDISSLSGMAGWLPPGPVDAILNLPLTYLNSLTTALGGTCSVVNPTLPYVNKQIELPCIKSIYQQIGAMTFVNWVGTIVSAFMLFQYFMRLYKWVDDTLTFRENNYIDNWGGI